MASDSSFRSATSQPRTREGETLSQVVQDLGAVLRSTRRRAQKWTAWQQLRDNNDNVIPYTPAALATLAAAFAQDENDGDLIQHLAIAYHALAWDLELHADGGASAAWEKALFYWRRLQACGEFWQDLCARGEKLGAEFDRSAVAELRRNLLTYLLEIHVDFIRHYHDLRRPEQAARHIELIKRARIPPAARKQLEALAYPSLTSGVPQMIAEGQFDTALAILDSFVSLFPAYVPALQTYLEVGKQWLDQLSPKKEAEWQQILDLDKRLPPRWDALKASPQLPAYPLARAALEQFAAVMGSKLWAKANSLCDQRIQAGVRPGVLAGEEYEAASRAIAWFRQLEGAIVGIPSAPFACANALVLRAMFAVSITDGEDEPTTAYQLFDQALQDCEEAIRLVPDEAVPHQDAADILCMRAVYRQNRIPSGLDDDIYGDYLRQVEEDLRGALKHDPSNTQATGHLAWVLDQQPK